MLLPYIISGVVRPAVQVCAMAAGPGVAHRFRPTLGAGAADTPQPLACPGLATEAAGVLAPPGRPSVPARDSVGHFSEMLARPAIAAQRRGSESFAASDAEPAEPEANAARRHEVDAYFSATARFWEDIYAREDIYSVVYRARLETVLAMVDTIGLPVGARCLDVGCGPGFATVALADRGYSVDAIDTTSFMLERTRERAAGAQLSARVTARRGDVHALDFPDGSFDLVLLVGVTEWLPDLDGPLREIVRVLKHDGHLVVTCDNRWALANVMDPMLNPALAPARHAIRRWLTGSGWSSAPGIRTTDYSIAGFDRALNAAGLVPVERSTVGFGPLTFLKQHFLPRRMRVPLHQRLQSAADRGLPVLRSAGFGYVVMACKERARARG